jgi:hypothetical protein
LLHGSFVDLPPEMIKPLETRYFSLASVGVLVGCEIALQYATIDDAFELYCAAPYIGSPYASVSPLKMNGKTEVRCVVVVVSAIFCVCKYVLCCFCAFVTIAVTPYAAVVSCYFVALIAL